MSFIYERKTIMRDTKAQAAAKRLINIMNEAISIIEADFPEEPPKSIEAAVIATEKALMCVNNLARSAGVDLD
jgi:hypothetical protein